MQVNASSCKYMHMNATECKSIKVNESEYNLMQLKASKFKWMSPYGILYISKETLLLISPPKYDNAIVWY